VSANSGAYPSESAWHRRQKYEEITVPQSFRGRNDFLPHLPCF